MIIYVLPMIMARARRFWPPHRSISRYHWSWHTC